MNNFNYNDIDLFYYHSTDIDITRIDSILKNGILSANMIKNNNLPYYHRNYINASCGNDYISISHFPRNIFHHSHIENELYENSSNKIAFVLDGDIDALDKQRYKNRYKYTNERHVKDIIKKEDIIGIVVRKHDLDKPLKNIPFKLDYTDWNDTLKKCFDIISFLRDNFNYETDLNYFHELVGKIVEAKIMNNDSFKILKDNLSSYMQNYIYNAYQEILDVAEPTLKDFLLQYQKDVNIYVMTKYDIKSIEEADKLICEREDKKVYKERDLMHNDLRLLFEMRDSDREIYLSNHCGPLTEEGEKIKQKLIRKKD